VAGGKGLLQSTFDGGQTWYSNIVSNTVVSVSYSRDTGTFLAFGDQFVDGTYTSQDGFYWEQNSNVFSLGVPSANAYSVWGRDKFVAVLDGDSNVLYSQDGVYWGVTTDGTGMDTWKGVAYGNGLFVACPAVSNAMVSSDGISWTRQVFVPTPFPGSSLYGPSIAYGNGRFVVVGNNQPVVMTTDPTGTWITNSSSTNAWKSITYGGGLFVAVWDKSGFISPAVMTSQDGINWTLNNSAPSAYWQSVTYGNGLFVAVGTSTSIMTATDPTSSSWARCF
jgi:hypothetical protein